MMCLGFEPRTAVWKAQTNPLSYGLVALNVSLLFWIERHFEKTFFSLSFFLFFFLPSPLYFVEYQLSNSPTRSVSISHKCKERNWDTWQTRLLLLLLPDFLTNRDRDRGGLPDPSRPYLMLTTPIQISLFSITQNDLKFSGHSLASELTGYGFETYYLNAAALLSLLRKNMHGECRHSSVDLSAPSICCPRFDSQVKFVLYFCPCDVRKEQK